MLLYKLLVSRLLYSPAPEHNVRQKQYLWSIDDLRLFKSSWNLGSGGNTDPFITNGALWGSWTSGGCSGRHTADEWAADCEAWMKPLMLRGAVSLKCFHSFLPGGHGRWPTFQNINAAFIWMFTFCPSVENAEARRWWSTRRGGTFCLTSSLLLILFYITQELNLLFSISVLTILQLMLHRAVLVTLRRLNL